MHEFRPAVRPSVLRHVLAVVTMLAVVVPIVGLGSVVYGMSDVSYAVRDGKLVVRTGDTFFGDRTVRLADVREARAATLHGGRRTAGTALPGYCVGHFSYADLGPVWQATDCGGRAVVLRVAGEDEPIVLTPPSPDDFLTLLRAGARATVTLPPPEKGPLFVALAILVPVLAIAAGMTVTLMLLGPNRMRYFVGGGALEVRTLYGRQRFPLEGATARAYAPSRFWRVAGTAMPGYYTGRFREDGRPTRIYATNVKDVVLVEGTARVIVSPRHRDGFLAALHAEGARVEGHGEE